MYYPHADDENVAMGYANYNNQTEESETMVTVREDAFRSYMFENYVKTLEKETLIEMLEMNVATEVLVDMDDDDDYDIITGDDSDWFDEEFAPYDDLDDLTEEE
mgnify:CR=1 FL=1